MQRKWLIRLIFSLVFIVLMLWNIFIPIFELPSEQLYFARIQYLIQNRRLPDLREFVDEEIVYPDTYPILMAPIVAVFNPPWVYNVSQKQFNPQAVTLAPIRRGTYNRFIHPPREQAFHWNNLELAVHGVRLLTSIFTLVGLIIFFRSLELLWGPNSHLPFVGLLIAGFHPKFLHRSASIVNIPLLFLAFSLFFYWALTPKPQSINSFKLGLAAGLALITKITGLNLLIFFGIYLLIFVPLWVSRIKHTLFFTTGFLIVSAWLLIRNTILYADPLALNQALRIASDLSPQHVIARFGNWANYWFGVMETTLITFWDGFGWEATIGTWPLHYFITGVTLISIGGFILHLTKTPNSLYKRRLVFLGSSLGIFTLNFLHINTQFFTPQGKDFFPLMLPIIVVMLVGLSPLRRVFFTPILPLTLLAFLFNLYLVLGQAAPLALGYRNISPSEYYARMHQDPLKRLWQYVSHKE